VEQRLDELERRQANLGSFREDVASQMQATEVKLTYLGDRDTEARRQDFQGQINGLKTS